MLQNANVFVESAFLFSLNSVGALKQKGGTESPVLNLFLNLTFAVTA